MQLDIFEHSRDVMLRNDVLGALEQRDAGHARACWSTLRSEYPQDVNLQPLALLIDVLAQVTAAPFAQPFVDAAALREARVPLDGAVTAAALGQFGDEAGHAWLQPLWQSLAQRAAALPFSAEHEADHAAPLWLRAADWPAAAQAADGIESWHRIPAPLAWMAEARWRQNGLDAAWGLLAELAWLSPRRFGAVSRAVNDPLMNKLQKAFGASFEGAADVQDDVSDLAWLPAWALTRQPRLAPFIGQARPSLHAAPEQAMRLMLELLGLERQGRHHDIVGRRKQLRDLNESLYASYLSTR